MGILIYDFMDEFYWVLLIFFSIFTLVGICILALWVRMVILLFRGGLNTSPILNRVLYVTVPLIIGCAFIIGAGQLGWKVADVQLDWFRGNYSQISGVLEDVTFTEDPYDDDETIEIDFAVSGLNFECSTLPEKAAQFEEGREVTVQYGWMDDELFVYRICGDE